MRQVSCWVNVRGLSRCGRPLKAWKYSTARFCRSGSRLKPTQPSRFAHSCTRITPGRMVAQARSAQNLFVRPRGGRRLPRGRASGTYSPDVPRVCRVLSGCPSLFWAVPRQSPGGPALWRLRAAGRAMARPAPLRAVEVVLYGGLLGLGAVGVVSAGQWNALPAESLLEVVMIAATALCLSRPDG